MLQWRYMRQVKEVWAPVVGFEEDYIVSNFGRVICREREDYCFQCKCYTTRPEFELKQGTYPSGYKRVQLRKKRGAQSWHRVHRLVAEAFLENPERKAFVNHKDFDRQNNCVTNLEWVTPKENSQHYHRCKP